MKIHGTRKQKAAELLRLLTEGPSFSEPFDGSPFTEAQATEQFQRWSASWILEDLKALVPELRKKS